MVLLTGGPDEDGSRSCLYRSNVERDIRPLARPGLVGSLGLAATLPFELSLSREERSGRRSMPDGAIPGAARGEMLAQISTRLVQLHSRYYGKGPTKAKTHIVDGTVVCILRGGFTTVERTLLDTGDEESVFQMRRSFQQAMETEFRNVVEEATGRNVVAYMSSIHADPDLAIELFVLEPEEEEDAAAAPPPEPA
jgi:uncharacterized protein YbcI